MAFLDKLKNFFRKDKDLSIEEVNEVANEKDNESLQEEKDVFDKSIDQSELFEILNSINIDYEGLALNKIESEAEAIANYIRSLLKDLDVYEGLDEKKVSEAINGISGKIKHITIHSLELKNLLANLEDHYYIPVIEALKKLNTQVTNEQILNLIEKLEKDLELVKGLDSNITRIVGYNGLFNPEKNPKYKEEIEKEAKKRLVHGHLNELLDTILVAVSDRTIGIKTKIERENPLEAAKKIYFKSPL